MGQAELEKPSLELLESTCCLEGVEGPFKEETNDTQEPWDPRSIGAALAQPCPLWLQYLKEEFYVCK